jgi:uncharacterized protein YacL
MKRVELIFRIIFMLIFAGIGAYYGIKLADSINSSQILGSTLIPPIIGAAVLGIIGAILGFLVAPYLTTIPAHYLHVLLTKLSTQTLVAAVVGLLAGLIVAALLAFPLSFLPSPFGDILPFIGVLVFGYVGVMVFVMRQNDIFGGFRSRFMSHPSEPADKDAEDEPDGGRVILCDTSVIIDGRIADVASTGFLIGTLLIPRFVLNELQYIADSPDNLRRQRGRRGMEVLSQLQKDATVPVKISDIDVEGVREVDEKLVVLARQMKAPILTNDYNLNRVAELQGVKVLNVNELANAVKSVLLPGESLLVNIIQEGREMGQGVAYLDDGTMVVVEDGRERINSQVTVTVTKILQTNAGRMIFARVEDGYR